MPPWAALAALSFSTLVYEISLTRLWGYLFPYHYASLAISSAMLGLGLGAWWRSRRRPKFFPLLGIAAALAALLAGVALRLPAWALFLLAGGPFLFAGVLFAELYESAGPAQVRAAYRGDLLGAALGAAAAAGLQRLSGPWGVTAALILVALAAALGRRRLAVFAFAAAALLLTVERAGMDPLLRGLLGRNKPMASRLAEGGQVVAHAYGSVGRADLLTLPEARNFRWIYNDATNSTLLVENSTAPARARWLREHFAAFAFRLRPPQRVALLGSGAGMEIPMAKEQGAENVEAVEINGAIVRLARGAGKFAGDIYDQPGVTLAVEDARHYIEKTSSSYSHIQLALVLTGAVQPGSYALAEGYLYTREAFRRYFSRLTDRGLLVIIDDSAERLARQTLTAFSVLRERGKSPEEALSHLAVFENPARDPTGYRYMLVAAAAPLAPAESADWIKLARASGFAVETVGGLESTGPYRALARAGEPAWLNLPSLDLSAPTDNHPFFFFMAKGPGAVAVVLPYLAAAAAAFLLAALFGAYAPAPRNPVILAGIYGAAFILVEMGFLQIVSLPLGGPQEVWLWALAPFLAACGWAGGGAFRRRRLPNSFWAAMAGVGIAALALAASWLWKLPEFLSRTLLTGALAAAGVAMGRVFPPLLAGQERRSIAALWAVSGICAVGASLLGLAGFLLLGIREVVLAGAALYLAAAFIEIRAR